MPKYLVKSGMNYGDKRVEPGDVVDDLPASAIPGLVESGVIEPVATEKGGKK